MSGNHERATGKRATGRGAGAPGILAVLAILAALVLLAASSSYAQQFLGTVARLQGDATVSGDAAAEGSGPGAQARALHAAAPIYARDVVRTGPDARVEIALYDGTRVTLGGNTVFGFEALSVDLAVDEGRAVLRMVSGAFRLAAGRVTQLGNTDVAVHTPLATIGIRGTEFWGGYFEPDEIGFFLFSGRPITVTNDQGTQLLPPGMGTFLRPGKPPSPAKAWGEERLSRAASSVRFGP